MRRGPASSGGRGGVAKWCSLGSALGHSVSGSQPAGCSPQTHTHTQTTTPPPHTLTHTTTITKTPPRNTPARCPGNPCMEHSSALPMEHHFAAPPSWATPHSFWGVCYYSNKFSTMTIFVECKFICNEKKIILNLNLSLRSIHL